MTHLFVSLQNALYNMRDREEGQTMAEYALVLALIGAVTALVFTDLGGAIKNALVEVQGYFS